MSYGSAGIGKIPVTNFNIGFYAFSEWNAAAATNQTVYYTDPLPTISLNSSATITTLSVNDDDGTDPLTFDDGYVDTPGDGSTPSTGNNDQVLDVPVTVNGTTYAAGSQVELEFAFVTTTGETFWIIRIDGDNVGISGPTLPTPGSTYTVDERPADNSNDGNQIPVSLIPCFTRGTMLMTDKGWQPVQGLRPGDRVQTADDGLQEIRWIGAKGLTGRDLKVNLQPILIARDSIAPGVPFRDLYVSPQHRMVIGGPDATLYFDQPEVFAAAKHLARAQRSAVTRVEYWHMMFDRHQVVFANGAASESFYPGAGGMDALGRAAEAEILSLFPELRTGRTAYGPTSRLCLTGREATVLRAA